LRLPRGPPARLEGRQVAAQRRGVPPAPVLDCADRAHAEAEVVPAEPVAEVVPGPQVARAEPGEAGRLVPAVAGLRQRLDDLLEVALHALGLPLELLPVGVREARSRLRFQL